MKHTFTISRKRYNRLKVRCDCGTFVWFTRRCTLPELNELRSLHVVEYVTLQKGK